MKIKYYFDEINNENISLFLAGPTPRNDKVESWRKEAIKYLNDFNGVLYIPEFENIMLDTYEKDNIIEWEEKALNEATYIMFWIPRSKELPGFTTNIEYGFYRDNKNIFVGFPKDTFKTDYILYYVKKNNTPFSNDLKELCNLILEKTK